MHPFNKNLPSLASILCLFFFAYSSLVYADISMMNVGERTGESLNGPWEVIVDPFDTGKTDWVGVFKDKVPQGKTDFVEYAFDPSITLQVPGDFNSQRNDLKYYESTVWYKRSFEHTQSNDRYFLHFGAVNYEADVYLNSELVGSHEGGFTPFQFEVTEKLKPGKNTVIVRVNNQRKKNGIPGLNYDWFNYGGITRDVTLIKTPGTYIKDYFIQLEKGSQEIISGWIQLDGRRQAQTFSIAIPELDLRYTGETDSNGKANFSFRALVKLWSPSSPKLYNVSVRSETDSIDDAIGFRSIEVIEDDIYLNGSPVFLKGINIHEEIPQRGNRVYSQSDSMTLLNWAKELGANTVRLAHYPHNELTVKLADRLGLMVWEEIPVYQSIDFADKKIQQKMNAMLEEMVSRDKNRSSVIVWSVSNETGPSKHRNRALRNMVSLCRSLDSTRLITSAFDKVKYEGNTVTIDDPLSSIMDILSVNEYLGWYRDWPDKPENVTWSAIVKKPLVMSEFGGEALYGNALGKPDVASSWSEEYQQQIYLDQISMFNNISFLRGTFPWLLADFRSPKRLHPVFQQGWNRKGLISDTGHKKKAWRVVSEYYKKTEAQAER